MKTRKNPLLYIMKQEPNGPYKIGVSQNPIVRLSTVQVGNPKEISLVETINPEKFCARTIEKKAKQILDMHHLRGEWYDTSLDVVRSSIHQAKKGTDERFAVTVSKKQAIPRWLDYNAITAIEIEARRISAISGFSFQVDYIIPLTHHLVCGLHVAHNMHIVSKARKGKYYEDEWDNVKTKTADPKKAIESIKSFSTRYDAHVARDIELTRWVMERTRQHALLPFKQRIHVALTGDNPVCHYGKTKQFRNFKYGWCSLAWCRCKKETNS